MKRILALLSVSALMVVLTAMPAMAQPLFTGGLVNVNITDVLTGNEVAVQIPIGVAANVCGVQANVLARGGVQEPIDCTASTTADLPVAFRP
jgi:hypothetical protein